MPMMMTMMMTMMTMMMMGDKGVVADANLPRFHLEPPIEPDWYSGQGLIDCQCIRDILIDC